jgi:hypothetical protein
MDTSNVSATSVLHLLLGVRPNYETDGMVLLKHILRRYSLTGDQWRIHYCCSSPPPPTKKERQATLSAAKESIKKERLSKPGPIIGFGWLPCETLTGRGKTLLKYTVGTRWGDVWITYDPAGALFDPNLCVDISAVLLAACRGAGVSTHISTTEPQFDWSKYL